MRLLALLPYACALMGLSVTTGVGARIMTKKEMHKKQVEAAKRWEPEMRARANLRRDDPGAGVKNITFSNPKASGESPSSTSFVCTSSLPSLGDVIALLICFVWNRILR